MKIFFLKVLMWIQIGVSRLADDVFGLFTVFAGIEDVRAGGEDVSLLEYFVTNKTVQGVFWALLVVGVACTMILTVVAVMKNMVTIKKTAAKIMGQMLVSVTSMVIVVAGLFAMIFGANCVLAEIDTSFHMDSNMTVGQQLFQAAVGDSWAVKDNNGTPEDSADDIYYNMADIFGPKLNSDGQPVVDSNGNVIPANSWKGITPDKVFGVTASKDFFFENEDDYEKNNGNGDWKEGYNAYVRLNDYNFFIGVPAVIILGVVVFIAAMGLVVRLYDLVFMLLCSPLIMATLPLDDGAKFKLWRETAISKTLLAYGSIFAINIYLIMLPLIGKIAIPLHPNLTTLAQVLLIICGALTISNGQLFFSRLLGTSAEESRQASHGMRAMFAGAMGTFGAVRGAARMTFGTYNQYTHQRERGLLGHAKSATRGVAGTAGTILTGGSERSIKTTRHGNDRNKLSQNLRERWRNRGGVMGPGRVEDIRGKYTEHAQASRQKLEERRKSKIAKYMLKRANKAVKEKKRR